MNAREHLGDVDRVMEETGSARGKNEKASDLTATQAEIATVARFLV